MGEICFVLCEHFFRNVFFSRICTLPLRERFDSLQTFSVSTRTFIPSISEACQVLSGVVGGNCGRLYSRVLKYYAFSPELH